MDDDTCNLFKRVAQKLGWAGEGGLDEAERRVRIPVLNNFIESPFFQLMINLKAFFVSAFFLQMYPSFFI